MGISIISTFYRRSAGWLVIDPKGVVGPAGYEVGPFMLNPWGSFSDGVNYKSMIKRRIDILHEHLGFERERLLEWSSGACGPVCMVGDRR